MSGQGSDRRGMHAPAALLPEGWATNVDIEIDDEGRIRSIESNVDESTLEPAEGPVVPGMPDVHSHAFQRALVGRTQILHGTDDFWSWRTLMYDVVSGLEPDDVLALTRWVYADLLANGYTAVGEFHYLHHGAAGSGDQTAMAEAVVHAARDAGIGLTILPVLYRRGGFDGAELQGPARQFALDPDAYFALVERLEADAEGRYRVGVAPHSLRAVEPDEIDAVLQWAADRPRHIHAAEQPQEVADCVATTGKRPVEWLLDEAGLDERWTVIHATHTEAGERRDLGASGAIVGLCPTTEADLGDGVFPLPDWLETGGRFAIGSDANVCVSPAEELRLLTYTVRLLAGRRGALPLSDTRPGGAQLWQRAAREGARSLGLDAGRLETGARADLLVLNGDAPLFSDLPPDEALDAFVLSGDRSMIARTVVCGRTVARHGRHNEADAAEAAARETLHRIANR